MLNLKSAKKCSVVVVVVYTQNSRLILFNIFNKNLRLSDQEKCYLEF